MNTLLWRYALIICTFLTVKQSIGQKIDDNTTLFSQFLKDHNAGFTYSQPLAKDPGEYKSQLNPDIFRLAYTSGFIIFIDEPKYKSDARAYKKVIKAFKKAGYLIYHVDNKEYLSFAIPKTFVLKPKDVNTLFDGQYSDVFIKYLIDWWDNRSDLNKKIASNNLLINKIKEKSDLSNTLDKIVDSLTSSIEILKREISEIDFNITVVDYDINPKAYSGNMKYARDRDETPPGNNTKFEDILKKFKDKGVTYIKSEDFFLAAMEKLAKEGKLRDVGGENWVDKNQAHTPFIHPDLAAAIEKINSNEGDALKKMGLPNGLVVTGAARTPYNQAVQIATQTVAAGMFSSNHLCGLAVDFGNEPAIIANYPAFSKLMAKYGLFTNPKLAPGAKSQDPKHVSLSVGDPASPSFNPGFYNNTMGDCLEAYQGAMSNERAVQKSKDEALGSENDLLTTIIGNIDDYQKTLKGKIDKLKQDKDALDKTKANKQSTLEAKTKERAVREIQKELKRQGKNVNDREIRARLGNDGDSKDGYWEKYGGNITKGQGFECRQTEYSNSRGEYFKSTECRTTPSKETGIQRLR